METEDRQLGGRRVITGLYVGIVAFAAAFGAILGIILPARANVPPMAEFGPLTFRITPVSFAVYGAVMIGVTLGVLLLVMNYIAEQYDDADLRTETKTEGEAKAEAED
jgi:hypothetical protein